MVGDRLWVRDSEEPCGKGQSWELKQARKELLYQSPGKI